MCTICGYLGYNGYTPKMSGVGGDHTIRLVEAILKLINFIIKKQLLEGVDVPWMLYQLGN